MLQVIKSKLFILLSVSMVVAVSGGALAYHYLTQARIGVSSPSPAVSNQPVALNSTPQPSLSPIPHSTTKPVTPTPKPQATVVPTPKPAAITLAEIVASINQSLRPYGVTASLSPANNSSTYSTWTVLSEDDASRLQQFKAYLIGEFSKYPSDLVANSGLKTIGLVKNLKVSGTGRAATPAPSVTSMLYDVDLLVNSGSEYAREVVSHEYWHYLDYKIQNSYNYADATWSGCNPVGFIYGSGGASAYNGGYTAAFHPQPAFITAYAAYAIEEDRAELFGWLIYAPASVKGLGDAGINCKISRLTTIVRQLSPAMSF